MIQNSHYAKAVTTLIAFALFVTGCTKTRDARLSDPDSLAIFAISDFGTLKEETGFDVPAKPAVRSKTISNKVSQEKTQVSLDIEESKIPERMRFMFSDLEVTGQASSSIKVVFGVDSKFVTAYKVTSDIASLSALEKQIALSSTEVQTAIQMQKAKNNAELRNISNSMTTATKARQEAIAKRQPISLLVPLFKYEIQAKGILERTKNELREDTSTLNLRETEFSQATHVKLAQTSDSRKDVGSAEQQQELDQLYSAAALDNKVTTAKELQTSLNINMKFIADDAKVVTKLDTQDLKVYEVIDVKTLTEDELRKFKSGKGNGEIIACKDEPSLDNKDANCVLRLAASVPVTYKKASLNSADKKSSTTNAILLEKATKAQNTGLVEIAKETPAKRVRPGGSFDPLNTIRVADLKGDFYFRRTFEHGSNMMTLGQAGTSGDLSVVNFELTKDNLIVRNKKDLIAYTGQGVQDREELMSLPVKYFKIDDADTDGSQRQVTKLIACPKEEAEYLEIDWKANTIPVGNSPLAYYDIKSVIVGSSSQVVTNMDMRLATDGILNLSLEGAYTFNANFANWKQTNAASISNDAQFTFNISERLSFKKVSDQTQYTQFAPNVSPEFQNALNFNIFTLADVKTGADVRRGREGSEVYRPVIHDFRNGKTLTYWVGGLADSAPERRELITQAAKEVVAEWNDIFRKAFAGTENERSGDYIILKIEDANNRGHLGDLDRNYLWFVDQETENGLLGVAQPAPNPYSGTIVAANVIVYSANSEKEVRGFMQSYAETRKYEKMLESAKNQALADLKKQMEEEKATAASPGKVANGGSAAEKLISGTKEYNKFLQRMTLAARPVMNTKLTSKYASSVTASVPMTRKPKFDKIRNQVSDVQFDSSKAFTRRVLEQALSGEFKNDPLMMEAIVARELARSEKGLSAQVKALLEQQANMKAMTAKANALARKSGGCFLYSRNEYNDKFMAQSFEENFKKEIKATLSHEMGHAFGLVHNFKASYDKANFMFPGESVGSGRDARNYSSIMDYLAATEMSYRGPGPYDLHALRAIYTGRVAASDAAIQAAGGATGALKFKSGGQIALKDGLVNIGEVQKSLGFAYSTDMTKLAVANTGVLKRYGQCHDGQVGEEPACTRYDSGASATEIVQNAIQDYNRSYIRGYHAADRLNFGWNQKVDLINRAIGEFQSIRGVLDDLIKMDIYGTASSNAERQDFLNAVQIGYDFFHDLIRTPNTNLSYGDTPEEIMKRMFAVPYTMKVQVTGADGKVVEQEKSDVRILEARALYDKSNSPDRLETIGIGYDKAFALNFLLTANPASMTDDSRIGWISYNEFEKYYKDVTDASQSQNMLTMLEIMSNQLKAGFVAPNHEVLSLGIDVPINQTMLDNAVVGSILYPNSVRYAGLDTYAEFFKVGTLRGGRDLTDRPTVTRIGQKSTSQTAVRYYAIDNATGASAMIAEASRRGLLLENKDALKDKIVKILLTDITAQQKLGAAMAKPENKDKKPEDVLKTDAELVKLQEDAVKLLTELTENLTTLNAKGGLVSAAELKANPNLAIESQVGMLRNLMLTSYINFSRLASGVQQVEVEKLQNLLQQLQQAKSKNADLAKVSPILGLGQEILAEVVSGKEVKMFNSDETISTDALINMIVVKNVVTSAQELALYVLEDLSRYTKAFNDKDYEN